MGDLAKQDEIWYGAVKGGSTARFFKEADNDVHKRLYQFMSGVNKDKVMMSSNEDGVNKVVNQR